MFFFFFYFPNSIFKSKLLFAAETWGGCSNPLLKKLQKLQDTATKSALGNKYPRDSPGQRQRRLGWLNIQKEIELSTHSQTWKILNLKIPEGVATLMPPNQTGLRIEAQHKLATQPRWLDRTKITRQAFRARAYKFNTLPGHITSQPTFKKFKKLAKAHLLHSR